MKTFFSTLLFSVVLWAFPVQGQEIPVLELFHGEECPHCQRERAWLPTLQQMYPSLQIKEYEVWHNEENKVLWGKRLAELGETPRAVPTNIIKGQVIIGFQKEAILEAMQTHYGDPLPIDDSVVVEAEESDNGFLKWIIIILGAGALIGGALWLGGRKS